MRIAVLTGLFACTLIFSVGTQTSSAQEPEASRVTNREITIVSKEVSTTVVSLLKQEHDSALQVLVEDTYRQEQAPAVPPEPTKHVVTENETLTTIAEKYQTTWRRLFDKNIQIENPDILAVGVELVIPTAEETLEQRDLPVPPIVVSTPSVAVATKPVTTVSQQVTTAPRGSNNGNGYVAGYCTWYVKNKRPDLPNNLGNASTWVSRAAAQGIATGSSPGAGAVGQRGNHVVYVESVNADGTVTISEMNYQARYGITTRTLPAN